MEDPRNLKSGNTDSNSHITVTKSHVSAQYHNVVFLSNAYKDDTVSLRRIIKTTGLQDSQLSRSSKYIQNLAS